MSASLKRSHKNAFDERTKTRKGGKNSVGRWTEKEHYLFLLAVKDHGKDWKKIEQFVKTRSSTQARSHAQKVLKDDFLSNIDEEIQKLALIYEKPAHIEKASDNSSSTKPEPEAISKGCKSKRKAKLNSKLSSEVIDNEQIIEFSNASSIKSVEHDDTSSYHEEDSEYSEYSFVGDNRAKLFAIEKVKPKLIEAPTKKKAKVNNLPRVISEKETWENRKNSVATSSGGWTPSTASPAKTASTVTLTPNPKNTKILLPYAAEFEIDKNEMMQENKNGCHDENIQKQSENKVNETKLRIWLKRGTSMCEIPATNLQAKPVEGNSWKSSYLKQNSYLFPELDEGLCSTHKNNNPDLNELGLNIFDSFIDFEITKRLSMRKMTWDEPNIHGDLLDSRLLLGDRKFPLFDQY